MKLPPPIRKTHTHIHVNAIPEETNKARHSEIEVKVDVSSHRTLFSCTQTNTNTLLLMTAPDQEELIDEMMNEIMTEAESDTHVGCLEIT